MAKLDQTQFAAHVALHAGVSLDEAKRAAILAVRRLAAWLDEGTRARAAAELPPLLADAIANPASAAQPLDEVVREPDMTSGEAHELVATVMGVLAEALTDDTRAVLAAALPPGIAALLVRRAQPVPPAHPAPRGSSLAQGRPGSGHPLAGKH